MAVLDEYMERKYGRPTRGVENPIIDAAVVGIVPEMALRRNPNRIGWIVTNLSVNNVYLAFSGVVGAAHGILLAPNGGVAHSWIEEDGELTQKEVWLVAAGAASAVYINEIEVM